MVIRECHSKVIRVHELKKGAGEDLFQNMGEFTLRAVAEIERQHREAGTTPCIHIAPMMLTEREIDALKLSDWMSDMEGLIADVERGPDPPPE